MRTLSFFGVGASLLIACGGSPDTGATDEDSSVGADTSAIDTGGGGDTKTDSSKDTGTSDTKPGDTTADTTPTDSGSGDTGSGDTGSGDTGATDTGTTDTGTVDSGTTDTGTLDTGSDAAFVCDATSCGAGRTCTRTYVTGGACLPCTGGCPSGMHCGGGCCTSDSFSYTYACKPTPSSCSSPPTCAAPCGSTLCPIVCGCESVSTDGVVTCHVCAP